MSRYIKSLDGIRGFGILFVLLYHYLRLNNFDATTVGFSWIWIQMFFVQSGYLITGLLLDGKSNELKPYLTRFYWRRLLRIFPVYFSYLFVFLLAYLIFNVPENFLDRAPYLFSFTYNYTRLMPDIEYNSVWFIHFWSLAVEEQFYLVWPFVIFFLNTKQLRVLIILILISAPIFRYWLCDYLLQFGFNAEMRGEITYAFTLSQFDAFACGAAIPIFQLAEKVKNPLRWSLIIASIVVAAGLVNFFVLLQTQEISVTSLGLSVSMIENYQHVWSYTLINVLFTFVILHLISSNYKGIFNNALLVSLGKIVFGLYIFHFGLLFLVSRLNSRFIHNVSISFFLGCLLCYGVAWLSYNFFEKKFLKFKDKQNKDKLSPK